MNKGGIMQFIQKNNKQKRKNIYSTCIYNIIGSIIKTCKVHANTSKGCNFLK